MHLTHNTIVALLWLVVFGSGGVIGGLVAWWRLSYRLGECCDCCTCKDCGGEDVPWSGYGDGRIAAPSDLATMPDGPAGPGREWRADPSLSARHTVLLEPGPTIYRALVPLDDESLYGPESHAKPSDSTFIRTVLMDWERRYPIPQDSPNGSLR